MDSFRIATVLVGAALTLPAFAQNERRIDNREENLEYRIQQGEKSGRITPQEAARLRKQQDHIRDLENKAEADGKVTKEERAQIEAAQDRASQDIARQAGDTDKRNAATGGTKPNGRDDRQANRIKQGEAKGQLTAEEAARLRQGQDNVRDLETKARADGKVTAEERAAIDKARDEQSKQIRAERRDAEGNAATGGTRK